MNRYRYLYLAWLLPLYFTAMIVYQAAIYSGIQETFESGEEYLAEVIDFDVKQIAAQTSGYVVLRFSAAGGETVEERLSLSVQMAQVLMEYDLIPVHYLPGSYREIVITPAYHLQRKIIRVNFAVITFGFIVTVLIAFRVTRFANRRIRYGEEELVIEHVDPAPQREYP